MKRASEELNDGLKTCRSMLNDYRVALSGESGAIADDASNDNALLREWRTQEDSNL